MDHLGLPDMNTDLIEVGSKCSSVSVCVIFSRSSVEPSSAYPFLYFFCRRPKEGCWFSFMCSTIFHTPPCTAFVFPIWSSINIIGTVIENPRTVSSGVFLHLLGGGMLFFSFGVGE